ncbi:MAG: thiamine-phosphate kinase, partial [Alphaproteobacteria bacterium]|nr:thiamine-phosphate kinase [Alphaproteobacteria bacterium]
MSGQNPDNPAAQPALAEASRSGEFDLIARYFAPLAGPGAFGLGDDAAVVTPGAGRQLVFTADAIIAGVHFLDNDPADDVAAKLLAVNLSDVAAMGAAGLGYLVTAAWPRDLEEAWIARFAQGLAEAQAEHGVALLGGDTVATNGPMSLSLTAIGEQPIGAALRRNGARVGDDIYVSGRIGDAGVGLRILRDGLTGGAPAERQTAIDRYRRPRPRLGLGRALARVEVSGEDGRGPASYPMRAADTVDALLNKGRIDHGAAAAAKKFEEIFHRASLEGVASRDIRLIPGEGALGGPEPHRILRARDDVWDAIRALGGIGSPGANIAWDVLGLGMTIKAHAERCQFGGGRSLNPMTATGILVQSCFT